MSLKNKLFSIAMVALGVLVFSAFAMAQDTTTTTPTPDKANKQFKGQGQGFGGPRRFEHGGPMGPRGGFGGPAAMFRGLNLTDAQKQQIQSILKSNRPDQASMDQMRTLMEAKRSGLATTDQEAQLKSLREQQAAKGKS